MRMRLLAILRSSRPLLLLDGRGVLKLEPLQVTCPAGLTALDLLDDVGNYVFVLADGRWFGRAVELGNLASDLIAYDTSNLLVVQHFHNRHRCPAAMICMYLQFVQTVICDLVLGLLVLNICHVGAVFEDFLKFGVAECPVLSR